jgi:glycosyltransferase involved in cell wall biosynthesis
MSMSGLKFAILNPFPEAAEMGSAYRMARAADKIGMKAVVCGNTDDVIASDPDFVIAMHHFVGKLTDHITFGYMCNPPVFFDEDPFSLRNVLSYDGWLNSHGAVSKLHSDLSSAISRTIPSCYFIMSSHVPKLSPVIPKTANDVFELCYVGANWDGPRFRNVFEHLSRRKAINIYGPAKAWEHCPSSYVGEVPWDGHSVFNVIRRHGVYLCLHKTEHRTAGVVNMRAFEGAAAGAVLICDNHPAIRECFGDNVYYVNMDADHYSICEQIEERISEINRDRSLAVKKARACHDIFKSKYCYEVLLRNVVQLYDQVKDSRSSCGNGTSNPLVSYIVRAGLRPPSLLERCLQSIANQTYRNIEVVVVIVSSMFPQEETIERFRLNGLSIKVVEANGAIRGEAIERGLRTATGKYLGIVDDDDVIFSDHTSTHADVLEKCPNVAMSHGGAVRVWSGERTGYLELFDRKFCKAQFEPTRERRRLNYFDVMTDKVWMEMNNVITSNSFLVRSEVFEEIRTIKHDLAVVEDYSLISELWKSGRGIRQAWRVTSAYYWEDHLEDNVTFNRDEYVATQRRFRLRDRLAHVLENRGYEGPNYGRNERTPVRRVIVGTEPILESRSDGVVENVRVEMDRLVTIGGWVREKNSSIDQALYLQTTTDRAVFVKKCDVLGRRDVPEHLGDYDYYWSGFRVAVKVADPETLNDLKLFSYSSESGWKELRFIALARRQLENIAMNMRSGNFDIGAQTAAEPMGHLGSVEEEFVGSDTRPNEISAPANTNTALARDILALLRTMK